LISNERGDSYKVMPAGDESSTEEEGVDMTDIQTMRTSPRKRNSSSSIPLWSEKATQAFKNVSLNGLPLLASLKTPGKNSNGLYEVYLYDTADDHDLFINQFLVNEGVVTSKVFLKKSMHSYY